MSALICATAMGQTFLLMLVVIERAAIVFRALICNQPMQAQPSCKCMSAEVI